ncbi:MAG: hypothetical protein WED33_12570 [Bacteroidia bacterium]
MRWLKLYGFVFSILFIFSFSACAPYYVKHQQFFAFIRTEQYTQAEQVIASSKKAKKKRNRLLYLLERGHVSFLLGKYKESSVFFLEADMLSEALRKEFGTEVLAYIINPNVRPYRAESFELVMMHYYHALAFVELGNYESALVECRRMNLLLENLAEKGEKKRKYTKDAFGHQLMASIYEVTGDYNNAFIAYRNALEVYETEYTELFQTKIPEQLKRDLINSAEKTGFRAEAEMFRKKFALQGLEPSRDDKPELVLFLEYGWGAFKESASFDFVFSQTNDMINFVNPTTGLSYSYPASSVSRSDISNLSAVNVFRVAFPRYVRSPALFQTNQVRVNGTLIQTDLIQPLSEIASQSLRDRFAKEMGEALLRFALKKATEYALRKENSNAGAILGITNAFTEQADTRNWQTLPDNIHYLRIPLSEGLNTISIKSKTLNGKERNDVISVDAKSKRKYIRSLRIITSKE